MATSNKEEGRRLPFWLLLAFFFMVALAAVELYKATTPTTQMPTAIQTETAPAAARRQLDIVEREAKKDVLPGTFEVFFSYVADIPEMQKIIVRQVVDPKRPNLDRFFAGLASVNQKFEVDEEVQVTLVKYADGRQATRTVFYLVQKKPAAEKR